MDNIVIIGGNHHNGLNLARMFGENGIKVEAIVIDKKKKSNIVCSKYLKAKQSFYDENSGIEYILQKYKYNKGHTYIFPYSDSAAYAIDNRLNDFEGFAYVPSINGKQGAIIELMDKKAQYDFAQRNNIEMAASLVYTFDNQLVVPENLFPCIVKPNISALGDKRDICICDNKEVLLKEIKKFRTLKTPSILIQRLVDVKFDALIVGCVYKNNDKAEYSLHQVIRKYPCNTGSGTYNQIINDKKIAKFAETLLNIIRSMGYYGLIDIELLIGKDDTIYLNEINWRNSGGGYKSMNEGFYYPFWFYCDLTNKQFRHDWNSRFADSFSMTEFSDINNVYNNNVKMKTWLDQRKRCNNFAIMRKKDNMHIVPVYLMFIAKNIIKYMLYIISQKGGDNKDESI